jgi:hypothetical protein
VHVLKAKSISKKFTSGNMPFFFSFFSISFESNLELIRVLFYEIRVYGHPCRDLIKHITDLKSHGTDPDLLHQPTTVTNLIDSSSSVQLWLASPTCFSSR